MKGFQSTEMRFFLSLETISLLKYKVLWVSLRSNAVQKIGSNLFPHSRLGGYVSLSKLRKVVKEFSCTGLSNDAGDVQAASY